jgi:hypothetical protein
MCNEAVLRFGCHGRTAKRDQGSPWLSKRRIQNAGTGERRVVTTVTHAYVTPHLSSCASLPLRSRSFTCIARLARRRSRAATLVSLVRHRLDSEDSDGARSGSFSGFWLSRFVLLSLPICSFQTCDSRYVSFPVSLLLCTYTYTSTSSTGSSCSLIFSRERGDSSREHWSSFIAKCMTQLSAS